MAYYKILLLAITCLTLYSCSSTSKVVSKDMNKGDIVKPIEDDIKYVEHRPYITSHLINNYDYDKMPYSAIVGYCNLSKEDPILFEEFTSILNERQANILSNLSEMEAVDVAKYYNSHKDERAFLKEELLDIYAKNIEEIPYQEAKIISEAFSSTDLASEIHKSLIAYRNKIYPYAEIFGEMYEERVFSQLSKMDIPQIAEYYKSNTRDQMFLTPVLSNAYLTNDSITYPEIRILYNEFQGTNLGKLIEVKYDSLRVSIKPFIEQGIDEYLAYEQEIVATYKSYAFEDAMTYYADASGGVLADFMAPSIGDVIEVICNDPVQFGKDMVHGIWDGAIESAESAWNWITGNSSKNKQKPEEKKESAEVIYARAYKANISDQKCIDIIERYTSELALEITQARSAFIQSLTDKVDIQMPQLATQVENIKPFTDQCDISEIKSIVDNRNKEDKIGDVIAYASYVPVIGDALTVVDAIYSLNKFQNEAEQTKDKLNQFQDKLNSHFTDKVNHYISQFFNNVNEQLVISTCNFRAYIYENY